MVKRFIASTFDLIMGKNQKSKILHLEKEYFSYSRYIRNKKPYNPLFLFELQAYCSYLTHEYF